MKRKVTTPENHTNPSGEWLQTSNLPSFFIWLFVFYGYNLKEMNHNICFVFLANHPPCLRQAYKIRFIFQYQPPTMNFLNIFFHPKSSSGFLTSSTNLSLCGASDPHLFAYFFIWQILILSSSFGSSPLNFGRTNSIIPAAPPLKFTTEITVDSHHPKHRRMKINI